MAVGTKRLTGVAVAGVVSAASDALAGAVLDIAASVMAGKWHPRRLLQRIPVTNILFSLIWNPILIDRFAPSMWAALRVTMEP
jgi:hypothetical protein